MVSILIIGVLVALMIVFFKVKYVQHKVLAIGLIVLVLFFYASVAKVMGDNGVEVTSFNGMVTAGKLYVGWLGTIFDNSRDLAGDAIKMDWKTNSTIGK